MHTGSKRETVILVHGTFASPEAKKIKWYEPESNFVTQLHKDLEFHGSNARCWAHCEDTGDPIFSWSGDNHWAARVEAASRLATLLTRLEGERWRTHVVAHSHGGNVLLNAVSSLGHLSQWKSGSLVTLGTPFLTTGAHPAVSYPLWLISFISVAGGLFTGGLLSLLILPVFFLFKTNGAPYLLLDSLNMLFISVASGLVLGLLAVARWFYVLFRFGAPMVGGGEWGRLLILSSVFDEAYRFLHTVDELAHAFGLRRTHGSLLSSWLRLIRATDRIDKAILPERSWTIRTLLYGGSIFVAYAMIFLNAPAIFRIVPYICIPILLLLVLRPTSLVAELTHPVHFLRMMIAYGKTVVLNIVMRTLQRRAWDLIRRTARGEIGYPFGLGDVSPYPQFTYMMGETRETIPEEAEQAALARRNKDVTGLMERLDKMSGSKIVATDLEEIFRRIVEDTSTVHASYYTDRACIGRIAQWVARSEDQIQAQKSEETGGMF